MNRAAWAGVVFGGSLMLMACNAVAASFSFPSFSSPSGLNIQGNAGIWQPVLRLTAGSDSQQGSAWYATKEPIAQGFTTTFVFRISNMGGITDQHGDVGGDGLAFVIQNESSTALPPYVGGSGIGYDGISRSLAVEFDTFDSAPFGLGDPNGNHVSVQTGGTSTNSSNHTYSLGATTAISNISDWDVHIVSVTYANADLQVSMDSHNILDVHVDLANTLGLSGRNAWVGFTAATGGAYENHDILSWSMSTVPEPSSIVLVGIAAISLLAYGGWAGLPLTLPVLDVSLRAGYISIYTAIYGPFRRRLL